MRKIWNSLIALIAPFWAIAKALRDIAQKLTSIQGGAGHPQPPIWRITESPCPSDTEVLYSSDPPPRRHPLDPEEDSEEEEKVL